MLLDARDAARRRALKELGQAPTSIMSQMKERKQKLTTDASANSQVVKRRNFGNISSKDGEEMPSKEGYFEEEQFVNEESEDIDA